MERLADLTAAVRARRALPPGIGFTRYVLASLMAQGDADQAANIAKNRFGDSPEVEQVLRAQAKGFDIRAAIGKSAVAAGDTVDSQWASPLVQFNNLASEFVALVRAATIIGKIAGLRHLPMNVRVPTQTTGASAQWVGQSTPTPLSQMGFVAITLPPAQISCLIAMTKELVRFSNPSGQLLARDDMIAAISTFADQQFISPGVAAVTNVSPASVTNGIAPIHSSGATVANLIADAQAAVQALINAGTTLTTPVWVMHPHTALGLSAANTSGVFAFPYVTINGGSWLGIPVVVSASVPWSVSGGGIIALLNARDILVADQETIVVDASEAAAIQMSTTPGAGPQQLVSAWQVGAVVFRATQYLNFAARNASCVAWVDGVTI